MFANNFVIPQAMNPIGLTRFCLIASWLTNINKHKGAIVTVVAFCSQKGGVSKSTLARALAVEAARSDLTVKVADLDVGQGSTVDWQRDRAAAGIEPDVPVQLHRTPQDALKHNNGADLLVIDGPARADKETLVIARVADLVVLPTGASLDDLRPAVRTANKSQGSWYRGCKDTLRAVPNRHRR